MIGIDASRAVTAQRTGTEAYAYFLIAALIPLTAQRHHELRLYFNQPPPVGLFPDAPHVETAVLPQRRLWTHTRLAWELHRNPPDVFFTPAHVIPLTYRRPSAATIHDLGYHHFPEAHPKRQLAYLRWSTRHNGRSATRIIADSQATKTDLIQLDHIPTAKIDVVYPGIDPDLAPVENEERITAVLQKYGIIPPTFSTSAPCNRAKIWCAWCKPSPTAMSPTNSSLRAKPAGSASPILEAIDNCQLTIANCQFVLPGYIEEADKPALLSGATALLFPSLYEGFGFPALEAQVCGTPVLTSNTSSLPEVVGNSAIQIDPLDTTAITTAIQNSGQQCRVMSTSNPKRI